MTGGGPAWPSAFLFATRFTVCAYEVTARAVQEERCNAQQISLKIKPFNKRVKEDRDARRTRQAVEGAQAMSDYLKAQAAIRDFRRISTGRESRLPMLLPLQDGIQKSPRPSHRSIGRGVATLSHQLEVFGKPLLPLLERHGGGI